MRVRFPALSGWKILLTIPEVKRTMVTVVALLPKIT